MTRTRLIGGLAIVLVTLLATVAVWPRQFLCFLPERAIAAILRRSVPVGSTVAEVQRYVAERHIASDAGRATPETIASRYPEEGVRFGYVRAELGHYRVVFRTDVVATFVFDAQGRLQQVIVRKEVDAI
ncbi:MAG TPA: hypothetical protein VLC46_27790 [Thermoanaerobaculia bacterium]|jgi:hypothetical protein|nr:hypothetical protein [Thermoanaerobaculia bacterium]